jgi:hypothetical protein
MWYYVEVYHSICCLVILTTWRQYRKDTCCHVSRLGWEGAVGSRHETIIVSFVVSCLFAYHVNVADCSCRTMARFDLKCRLLRIVLLFSYRTRNLFWSTLSDDDLLAATKRELGCLRLAFVSDPWQRLHRSCLHLRLLFWFVRRLL